MALTLTDVQRVAHLARLEITPEQTEAMLAKLSGIFALIEKMQQVDTRNIEPMAHAQDVVLALREDMVTESDAHELYQSVAPQVEAGLYLVPKVID